MALTVVFSVMDCDCHCHRNQKGSLENAEATDVQVGRFQFVVWELGVQIVSIQLKDSRAHPDFS